MPDNSRLTRREFLKSGAAVSAALTFPFLSQTNAPASPKDIPLVRIVDNAYSTTILAKNLVQPGKLALSTDGRIFHIQYSEKGHNICELVNGISEHRFHGAKGEDIMDRTEVAVSSDSIFVYKAPLRNNDSSQGVSQYNLKTGEEKCHAVWGRSEPADRSYDMAIHPTSGTVSMVAITEFNHNPWQGLSIQLVSFFRHYAIDLVCFDPEGNRYLAGFYTDKVIFTQNSQGDDTETQLETPKALRDKRLYNEQMAFDPASGNLVIGASIRSTDGYTNYYNGGFVLAVDLKKKKLLPIAELNPDYVLGGLGVDRDGNIYLSASSHEKPSGNEGMIIRLNRRTT